MVAFKCDDPCPMQDVKARAASLESQLQKARRLKLRNEVIKESCDLMGVSLNGGFPPISHPKMIIF